MTMKSVDLPHLRSVVLAGHAGAGKTTLAEQLMFKAGAIPRLGRVDDGTAHLDFEPEEQRRRMSLSLAVGTFERDGTRISLVDTPGLHRFRRRRHRRLRRHRRRDPCDGCLGRRRGWPREGGGPRAFDDDRDLLLHQQVRPRERRSVAGARRAPRELRREDRPAPARDRAAESFDGIVDLVHRKAYRWDGSTEVEIPIPDDMADEVARRRDQLLEAAAEADDDVLTKYLEGEEIADAELEACLRKGVKESVLAPVLVGSSTKGIGLRGLLDAIVRYLPSPADEPPVKATDKSGATVELPADENGPLAGPRIQDHRRSVRRAADLPARPVGHAPFAGARLELRPGARTNGSASCCCCTARSRSRSASSRRARSERSRSWPLRRPVTR